MRGGSPSEACVKLRAAAVMLGGHMDSWHSGTGATDNAAGVAVAMEAMRLIKALGLKPRRTIRIALWAGEEQGLLGSRVSPRALPQGAPPADGAGERHPERRRDPDRA